jgi:hypothetical protein
MRMILKKVWRLIIVLVLIHIPIQFHIPIQTKDRKHTMET